MSSQNFSMKSYMQGALLLTIAALVVKVLSAGAKSYLVKPQKPNVLVQKALAVLKTR